MEQGQLTLKIEKDNSMVIIGFIFCSFLSFYLIWSYRYSKKKENEGLVIMPPSKAAIPPIIFFILIAIVCFLHMTGLWDIIVEWLRVGQFE